MNDSLHRFFWEDSRTRWTVYAVAGAGGTAFAAIRDLYFHKAERQVTFELVGFIAAAIFLSTFLYCFLNRKGSSKAGSQTSFRLSPRLRYAGAIACLVLICSPRVSVSTVQAAIVNQRLERAASQLEPDATANLPNDQLKARFQNIASIAGTSIEYQIRARPELVEKVQNNLADTLNSVKPTGDVRRSGAAAFVSLVAYARYNHVLVAVNTPTILFQHGETGNSMVSQVPLNGGAAWWQGSPEGNTIIAIPSPGLGPVFPVSNARLVFNQIDFMGFGRAFIGTDKQSQIAVMNAKVTGASQTLDSIVWLNVNFVASNIIYNGGPLYLGDVTFTNCKFEFGPDEISQAAQSQILRAASNKVTLVSGLEK